MKLHSEHWNPFSEFLRENMNPDEEGRVYRKESTVLKALADSSNKLKSAHKFTNHGGFVSGRSDS